MKKHFLLILILLLAFILRVPFLDKYPAGLNADEAAVGYNAYSLLQTGRDEHGTSWPLVFRSFDDYKPAGYFYLVLPFVASLGLNVWAVRLPSALLGVLSVYFIYLLTNKLFSKSQIGHLAALMLTISPWHIHFSRAGWEVNAASTFMVIGLYFLLKSLLNTKYFLLTTIFFVLSLYTYHSLRIIIPLVSLAFLLIYLPDIKSAFARPGQLKPVIISVIIGLLLLIPLILQFASVEGRSRFSGVSVFADSGPYWEALEYRRDHSNIWINRSLHSRLITYSRRFVENYLSHFSPTFLFISGDEIARSKTPDVGQLLFVTAPFLLIGFLILLSARTKEVNFLLAWLFISPLAAALTFQSPHALRAQNMVYPLAIITALGLFKFLSFISSLNLKLLTTIYLLLITMFGYNFSRYLHQYYVHYPKELPYAWQYGFDQIGALAKSRYDSYDRIIISDRYDQPYILLAFFSKYSPQTLQKEIKLTPRDKFGFSTVTNFGKYEFHRIDWGKDSRTANALIITADEKAPDDLAIGRILDPAGRTMYRIYDTNKLK